SASSTLFPYTTLFRSSNLTMGRALKMSLVLVLVVAAFVSSAGWRIIAAQEDVQTPSQKTKDAVDKFNAAPAAIGKALQGLKEAARAKLQQTLGGKREPDANPDSS